MFKRRLFYLPSSRCHIVLATGFDWSTNAYATVCWMGILLSRSLLSVWMGERLLCDCKWQHWLDSRVLNEPRRDRSWMLSQVSSILLFSKEPIAYVLILQWVCVRPAVMYKYGTKRWHNSCGHL